MKLKFPNWKPKGPRKKLAIADPSRAKPRASEVTSLMVMRTRWRESRARMESALKPRIEREVDRAEAETLNLKIGDSPPL